MDGTPLTAHSRAEIRLFCKATLCPLCAKGPLEPLAPDEQSSQAGAHTAGVRVRCKACGEPSEFSFRLPPDPPSELSGELEIINPTEDPSRIIDVSQWITLYAVLYEEAARTAAGPRKRLLELQAGQCLDEALKFFEDDQNDLPPASAFFDDSARLRLRDHPQEFSRQRLISFRASLPRPLG
ncbi:MAG: hypothetical protein IH987_08095 [Planctomycetes bacterium]|nr:hypothetical protein [Planctomycetota bacterium]